MEIAPLSEWIEVAGRPLVIAGPDAVRSRDHVLRTAGALSGIRGISHLHASLFPTGPERGPVGEDALSWLVEAGRAHGLGTCTGVANARQVEAAAEHGVDAVGIGAALLADPSALREVAEALAGPGLAALVPSPPSPDLALWTAALEELERAGVRRVAAVHRGFAPAATSLAGSRPGWRLPLELKRRRSGLPVLCAPCRMALPDGAVARAAQAAVDAGLDGFVFDVDDGGPLTPAALAALLEGLVLRAGSSADPDFADRIAEQRRRLDRLDDTILTALAERWETIREIAHTKAANDVIAFQKDRASEALSRWRARGEALGLPPELVEDIYLAVHEASVEEQTRLLSALDTGDDGRDP
jgi:chorismate mutase